MLILINSTFTLITSFRMGYLKILETRHWKEVYVITRKNLSSLKSTRNMAQWKANTPITNFSERERKLGKTTFTKMP